MNLLVYLAGYLGKQAKDTPHLGSSAIFRYAKTSYLKKNTDALMLSQAWGDAHDESNLAHYLMLAEDIAPQHLNHHSSTYLLAQAVNLQIHRDALGLSGLVDLTHDEYSLLTALLNHHFEPEGITFIESRTKAYWFAYFHRSLEIKTHALQTALHQNIQAFQPAGADGAQLRTIINQTQMLLHQHAINIKREDRGEPTINSLWFSGEGKGLQKASLKVDALIGNTAFIQACANRAATNIQTITEALEANIENAIMQVRQFDDIDWNMLTMLLKKNKIAELHVYLPHHAGTLSLSLRPIDLWKIWRKKTTLHSILEGVNHEHTYP